MAAINSNTVYLITGANRGIGLGLLQSIISRPRTTIIAAVRNVDAASKSLSSVSVGEDSKLIIVKIDALSETDPDQAALELTSKYNINKIDVLVSNAGLLGNVAPVLGTSAQVVRDHLEVNTIAPLNLIKAFFPLLSASQQPRFFVLTSAVGTMGNMEEYPVPFFAYGLSKAAANYLVRKLHFENPSLISMAFNPGWVQTDMGNFAATSVGMAEAPITSEDSIKGLVSLFDNASIEKSGTFTNVSGEPVPW
ncbi:putative aflatoxin biosynthesis ketoreductase nor-1 [Coleophoma cylindrospora]|uniref:Putative aflatoxin biosynthesis ketoreductase nor-1 n=1 Tax=Coleophoma cylindrospora TaxID=1849047 RepID=A0A3D8SNX7_9HELO|nr:putative aflatoxin biosynthesis ketoreductase nor-1 [Coleophoma cylindrospora]